MTKQERLIEANKVLEICSRYGRRFFSNISDRKGCETMTPTRISHFVLDERNRLWYIDSYQGDRVYTAAGSDGFDRGFTEGGTLRSLCQSLAKFIRTGEPIGSGHFGKWPEWYSGGDPWGYGEDMQKVREAVKQTKAVKPPQPQAVP
jgi:hypothetical protein